MSSNGSSKNTIVGLDVIGRVRGWSLFLLQVYAARYARGLVEVTDVRRCSSGLRLGVTSWMTLCIPSQYERRSS